MNTDEQWLRQTIDLAVTNVTNGGGPFGAIVVKDDGLVATGQNRVTDDLDPTAHAEVQAIRAAAKALGDFSLKGCVLYSSCEPCPMCLASSLWARLDRVVYAADRHDAADGGFDDREFYDLFARPRESWAMGVEGLTVEGRTAPFEAWLAHDARTDY